MAPWCERQSVRSTSATDPSSALHLDPVGRRGHGPLVVAEAVAGGVTGDEVEAVNGEAVPAREGVGPRHALGEAHLHAGVPSSDTP